MKIIAIIQARMGSTRLPGKVKMDLCGEPVLSHVVNRVGRSRYVDKVIVATGTNDTNEWIRELCYANGITCYSGSEDDVLDRYYQAAKALNTENNDLILRITADCPLIDPEIIDEVIKIHIGENADYTSNTIKPTFPDGLDCEIFKFSTLEKAWKEANLKSEREHVTQYIIKHPEIFKIASYESTNDLSSLRWTLDEQDDYELIKIIYKELYRKESAFLTENILNLLDKRPELMNINSSYLRNEGLSKSISEDRTND